MAQKKAHEAEIFLKNKPQSYPVLLIYGTDKGLVSEYAKLFAQNCGVDLKDDFSLLKMEADSLDKDPSRLIDEAQTIGFFSGKRLIWVHYSGSGGKGGFSEAVKFLLENPPKDCFLLIEAGDLKKGIFLRKIIEESGQAMALPCYADEGQALQKLINETLAEFQCSIAEDARALLQNYLGADRRISRSELEKLCLYAQKIKHIETDDVVSAVSDARALAQDDIADAVLCGDIADFNVNFNRCFAAGTPDFLIVSALTRQFLQMQNLRFQIEREDKTIAMALASARPPIFFKRKKIMEQALAIWSSAKIARALERLQNTVLDSRKFSALGSDIVRQNLLALAVEAARSRRK